MGSGIVFVIIIGLWAVVLVPMWIRNHDATVESKSVDRFSTAMRTLSRRGSGPSSAGSRDLLVPATTRRVEVSGGRAPSAAARRAHAAKQARMRRRRSAVLALAGFLLVVLAAAVIGAAPLWLPGVVLLLTAGFVWNLRAKAVREARLERRQRRTERSAPVAAPVRRRYAAEAPIWPVAAEGRTAVRVESAFTETIVVADVDSGWAPTPVVLPTYVTAPPATSVPRVIDLTHPGSWSAAHMLDAVAAAGAPDPDEIFDGRVEQPIASATAELSDDTQVFDQYDAEHEAVAAGNAPRPFLEDDAIFDQDDDQLLALLERRASGS